MKPRPDVPQNVAAPLLAANRHTCCICNEPRKHVIIHHIDGVPSNNHPGNLAVLCHDCHSRVTGDEGLGRRFSLQEVKEYKRRWETRCSVADEETDLDEPVRLLYEITRMEVGTNKRYDFELENGQELVASLSADQYIDVSICTPSDYERWYSTGDLEEYEGAEEVRECELSFIAPRAGIYCLLLVNESDSDAEVIVDVATWDEEEDDT